MMTIEPVTIHDAEAVYAIARANGLPESWSWPADCYGGVAKEGKNVLAFVALKEVQLDHRPFLAIEEFRCEKTFNGYRALEALGDYLEQMAALDANTRNAPIRLGGFVSTGLAKHLSGRGFSPVPGELLAKEYFPQAREAVA